MKKIGFIGCGNMGSAMLKGALQAAWCDASSIAVYDSRADHLAQLASTYGVIALDGCADIAKQCKLIVLAVKPQQYEEVIIELKDHLREEHIVIPIAPTWSIKAVRRVAAAPALKVARIMPNMPAQVGCGVSGYVLTDEISTEEGELVVSFFKTFGDAHEVKEELMTAVGSVGGCSPGFIYMVIEALMQGAVDLGMNSELALQFAAKAVAGTAQTILDSGTHPAIL
ncbi:MAG TPA: pyrroline-5-carboxylate reductase, partial [Clostridiaceae bacterium]|nr:pyrroline-5-carboxylate reductase [Clostridiaceae bacterium]